MHFFSYSPWIQCTGHFKSGLNSHTSQVPFLRNDSASRGVRGGHGRLQPMQSARNMNYFIYLDSSQ